MPLTGLRVSQKARGMLVFVEGTGHSPIIDPGPKTAHSGGACGAVGTRLAVERGQALSSQAYIFLVLTTPGSG